MSTTPINPSATSPTANSSPPPIEDNFFNDSNLEIITGVFHSAMGLVNTALSCYFALFSNLHHFEPCTSTDPSACYTKLPYGVSALTAVACAQIAFQSFDQAIACFKRA